jgi:hypothetical protein
MGDHLCPSRSSVMIAAARLLSAAAASPRGHKDEGLTVLHAETGSYFIFGFDRSSRRVAAKTSYTMLRRSMNTHWILRLGG